MSRVEETKLKLCPFCGGEAILTSMQSPQVPIEMYIVPEYYCLCLKCGARTASIYDKQKAMIKWNRRNNEWLIL